MTGCDLRTAKVQFHRTGNTPWAAASSELWVWGALPDVRLNGMQTIKFILQDWVECASGWFTTLRVDGFLFLILAVFLCRCLVTGCFLQSLTKSVSIKFNSGACTRCEMISNTHFTQWQKELHQYPDMFHLNFHRWFRSPHLPTEHVELRLTLMF